jgi:hypothetical protein
MLKDERVKGMEEKSLFKVKDQSDKVERPYWER